MDDVDWGHYAKHKDVIDEQAKELLEKGTLQDLGHPPGPTLEITAKSICTIFHKDPKKNKVPNPSKPLSASQKRKFDRTRPPDKTIEYELKEGEGFKIIPNEEYEQPPSVQYVKNGKKMPEGWQPFRLDSVGPLDKNVGSEDKDDAQGPSDRAALPAEHGQ